MVCRVVWSVDLLSNPGQLFSVCRFRTTVFVCTSAVNEIIKQRINDVQKTMLNDCLWNCDMYIDAKFGLFIVVSLICRGGSSVKLKVKPGKPRTTRVLQ